MKIRQGTPLSCRKVVTGLSLFFPTTSAHGGHGLCEARVHGTGLNRDPSFPFPPSQNPSVALGARGELQARGSCAKRGTLSCSKSLPWLPAMAGEPSGELRRRLSSFPEVHRLHRRAGLPVSEQGEVGCAPPRDRQLVQHAVQHVASPSASADPSSSPGT